MNKLLLGALIMAGSIGLSSCNDEWDDHYAELQYSGSGSNLWEALKSNPDFSVFTDTLAKRGYDAVLSGSRVYTVFAPTNEAMQNFQMDGNLVNDEFIKNHIAYFYHNVNSVADTSVTMLNDKLIRLKGYNLADRSQVISSVIREDANMAFGNGLLQPLTSILPYKPNIWEYIGKETNEYKKYLYLFNVERLNVNESTPGPINDQGQTVYLDSVTDLYNALWGVMGYLNNEDSTYVSLVLDDAAWAEAHDKIEKNYLYYPNLQYPYFLNKDKEAEDSLARLKDASINLLSVGLNTFRKSQLDAGKADPTTDVYKNTAGLLVPKDVVNEWLQPENSTFFDASNGEAYLTSRFLYDAPGVWQDTVTTEAENVYRLLRVGTSQRTTTVRLTSDTLSVSPLSTDYEEGQKHEVSSGAFLSVTASSAQCANATFGVANTLSGAYDIWVTFMPGNLVPGIAPKPSSARATVAYTIVPEGETSIQTKLENNVITFDIDPYAVTRIKIHTILNLAPCYEGFLGRSELLYNDQSSTQEDLIGKKYGVRIQLVNNTRITDRTTDHNLYIDNIELVPHREN